MAADGEIRARQFSYYSAVSGSIYSTVILVGSSPLALNDENSFEVGDSLAIGSKPDSGFDLVLWCRGSIRLTTIEPVFFLTFRLGGIIISLGKA